MFLRNRSRLSAAIQTHFEECSGSTSQGQVDTCVLVKFSFVSTVEKQFDSTGEWMISTGGKDSDFTSKCRQPFDLTVQ